MKNWDQRPFEIRNLFNPAFCGFILFHALEAYEQADHKGMPFSLSLLVLPLSLNKTSREVIANKARGYLLKTTEDNPQILVGFAEIVTNMLPYTLEGFGLLMERGCITVSSDGRLQITPKSIKKKAPKTTEEMVSCQRVASIVGKEFARIGDRATIYKTFGIRP